MEDPVTIEGAGARRGPVPGRHVLARLPLRGAGGEPVSWCRTIRSHGVADLPPMAIDDPSATVEVTLALAGGPPSTVRLAADGGDVVVEAPAEHDAVPTRRAAVLERVRHLLRLDEDLTPFYRLAAADPELGWVTAGAGRLTRCGSVFEEVVKTVCTTNCTWAATERMTFALVERLGEPAPGAPEEGWRGRAFPTPEAMLAAGEAFYRDVARAGYRGAYLRELARLVVSGQLDLEALGRASRGELSDAEVEARLLALPGVGPYAAAHVMMMLGRYSRPILDSWTRPTYARLRAQAAGRRVPASWVSDEAIRRRFRRYGAYAGLAFWLYLTRSWVDEPSATA